MKGKIFRNIYKIYTNIYNFDVGTQHLAALKKIVHIIYLWTGKIFRNIYKKYTKSLHLSCGLSTSCCSE